MNENIVVVYNILSFLNGNDSIKRKNAEIELELLKKKNGNELFINLLEILNHEKIDLHIRRLSGLILKNEIGSCSLLGEWQQFKWLCKINKELRKQFKQTLFHSLCSPSKIIRRTVSQVLAKIAFIELKNDLWSTIFEDFLNDLSSKNHIHNFYEGILEVIEFLFQEFFSKLDILNIFEIKSMIILNIILAPIKDNTCGEESLNLAALKTLHTTLHFIDLKRLTELEIDLIFSIIINQITNPFIAIRKLGFEILEIMVKQYYGRIDKFISIIFDLTLMTIQQDNEDVSLKAIEVWTSLADEEFHIALKSIQALSEGTFPKSYSKQLTIKSGKILTFILLNFIENRDISEIEDGNCKSTVGLCLNLLTQASPNEILSAVVEFIEKNINLSSKLKAKQTAVFSLIAIFDGIGSKVLYNHLFKTSFLWLSFSESEHLELRQITFFLFGKIFQISPFILRINLDQVVQILLKNIFGRKIKTDIFWILNEIFQSFEAEGLLEWYLEIICSTVFNLISQTISEGKMIDELFEIICSIILNSSTRSQSRLFLLIPNAFITLRSSFITKNHKLKNMLAKIQSHLFRLLGSTIQRFGQKFTQLFLQYIVGFIYSLLEMTENLNLEPDLEDELIILIGTVIQKYKKNSGLSITEIMPILFGYVKKNNEHQSVSVAVGIIGDVCTSYENINQIFLEKATITLINLLQSENINFDTKPLIISCLGDLSFASGKYFYEFRTLVIPIIKSTFEAIHTQDNSTDVEVFQWILLLKESLVESLTGLIQGDPLNSQSKEPFDVITEFNWLIKSIYDVISGDRINRTTKLCIGLLGDCANNYKSKKKKIVNCTWIKQLIVESILNHGPNSNYMSNWALDSIYEI